MRVCNGLNGLILIVAAVAAFLVPTGPIDLTVDHLVLAGYAVFCGSLMCLCELEVQCIQLRLRRNFGWLYAETGRTIYLFFTASVAASFGTTRNFLMYAVAAATVANGVFNWTIIRAHPSYSSDVMWEPEPSSGSSEAPPPSAGETEAAFVKYLASHPTMMAGIVASLAGAARGGGVPPVLAAAAVGAVAADPARAARVALAIAGLPQVQNAVQSQAGIIGAAATAEASAARDRVQASAMGVAASAAALPAGLPPAQARGQGGYASGSPPQAVRPSVAAEVAHNPFMGGGGPGGSAGRPAAPSPSGPAASGGGGGGGVVIPNPYAALAKGGGLRNDDRRGSVWDATTGSRENPFE